MKYNLCVVDISNQAKEKPRFKTEKKSQSQVPNAFCPIKYNIPGLNPPTH